MASTTTGTRAWRTPGECRPGDRVGRYTLLQPMYGRWWKARCECGTEKEINTGNFLVFERRNSGCRSCTSKEHRCGRKPGKTGKYVVSDGISVPAAAKKLGMSTPSTIYNRIKNGWTVEEATTFPIGEMPKRFQGDIARERGLAAARRLLAKRGQPRAAKPSGPPPGRPMKRPDIFTFEGLAKDMYRHFQECGGVL